MACVAVPIVEGIIVKTAEWILVQKERKEEARTKALKGEEGNDFPMPKMFKNQKNGTGK